MMLASLYREQAGKSKNIVDKSEMTYSVSYPTGLLPLDLATGYIQEIDGQQVFELGFSDGSINTLIGPPGVGKTTLLVQMACEAIKPFRTSAIFFEQAEVGTNIQRIKNLSGITDAAGFTNRFIVRDAGITVESVYDRLKSIYDIKVANADIYQYDTGLIDMMGRPVYKFEPTFFIIDSVKMLTSQSKMYSGITGDTKAKDNVTNMDGAQEAGAVAVYLKKMAPLCRIANIILILVNHITPKISSSYGPEKPEFPYLKPGEHLGSARLLHYLSNVMLRLDIVQKLVPGDEKNPWGIDGYIVQVDAVKNRTSKSGRGKCYLISDQSIGYDKELSMLLMLKLANVLEGAGAYLRLPGCDRKFALRNFKKILHEDEELFNTFDMLCFNHVKTTLVEEYERIKREIERASKHSVYDAILNQFGINTNITYVNDLGKKKTKKANAVDAMADALASMDTTNDTLEAEDTGDDYDNIDDD